MELEGFSEPCSVLLGHLKKLKSGRTYLMLWLLSLAYLDTEGKILDVSEEVVAFL